MIETEEEKDSNEVFPTSFSKYDTKFADDIASYCYSFYEKLPKTGKPKLNEWTVLSCVIKTMKSKEPDIVSLGTGSKCIGQTKMSPSGDILNDSHAEVMARRGFLRYLYEQIELTMDSKESIFFLNDEEKFCISSDVEFHFFSSQLPCGDAAILKDCIDKDNILIENTGAKCIDKNLDVSDDASNPILGQVRRKPGRGDPTLSLSCSDKLARWLRVGFQGALLDIFLKEPITVQTIIIANDNPLTIDSLHRALIIRDDLKESNDVIKESVQKVTNLIVKPILLQSAKLFKYGKELNKDPSPSSIVWCKVKDRPFEVAVEGKKQGITKKNALNEKYAMQITKRGLYSKFLCVSKRFYETKKNSIFDKETISNTISYRKLKQKSTRYRDKWKIVKQNFFKIWCEKPDYDFSLEDTVSNDVQN